MLCAAPRMNSLHSVVNTCTAMNHPFYSMASVLIRHGFLCTHYPKIKTNHFIFTVKHRLKFKKQYDIISQKPQKSIRSSVPKISGQTVYLNLCMYMLHAIIVVHALQICANIPLRNIRWIFM